MKHFLLKFNHGVEIGARMAYLGHYNRTKDNEVYEIAIDEYGHQLRIEEILYDFDDEANQTIDLCFTLVGNIIYQLCKISPIFMLNWVARSMEVFAIFNYGMLANVYPFYSEIFHDIADKELLHKEYFK